LLLRINTRKSQIQKVLESYRGWTQNMWLCSSRTCYVLPSNDWNKWISRNLSIVFLFNKAIQSQFCCCDNQSI